jgi:hypothetical protein
MLLSTSQRERQQRDACRDAIDSFRLITTPFSFSLRHAFIFFADADATLLFAIDFLSLLISCHFHMILRCHGLRHGFRCHCFRYYYAIITPLFRFSFRRQPLPRFADARRLLAAFRHHFTPHAAIFHCRFLASAMPPLLRQRRYSARQ